MEVPLQCLPLASGVSVPSLCVQVTIPLGTFRPASAGKNKKTARMEAATAALQGLGLVQKEETEEKTES